ncbi:MAG: DNA repair protein RecN [Deltaproteobacteria bacterium]|nr:DNA repair protein RecN [Deltaproteobacteria bacterium]
MLRSLAIRDFVLIPGIELTFGAGLTVITGETGAGKSALLEAVRLLLGGRAEPDLVRAGAARAELEALFDLPADHPVRGLLAERDYPADDELLVRRTIPSRPGARGQITVNGRLATAAILRELAAGLVAVSSQHEQRTLTDPATHLDLLDAFAGCGATRSTMLQRHRALAAARAGLADVVGEHGRRLERADWLRERVRELERAALRPGELAELEADLAARKAGARLAGTLERAAAELAGTDDEPGAAVRLARAEAALCEAAAIDARLGRLAGEAAEARAVADDVAAGLAAYRDRMDFDPARLEALEDRLHLVRRLVRAHGGTEEAVRERLDGMRAELDLVDRHDDHLARAEAAVRRAEEEAVATARELTAVRSRAARKLSREITAALEWLGMAGASVEADVRPLADGIDAGGRKVGPLGADAVELLFAPNPGEGRRALERIASGGELSRLLLAVKRVLADREPLATYLFDEVDAGVSGEAARRVAAAIRDVARHHQVLCVTHLPAVAAQGEAHFEVEKREEDGRTVTSARALGAAERVEAIARLLGGAEPGPKARAAAAELLRRAVAEEA